MAEGHLYLVEPTGGLRQMRPAAPETDDRMQELVALYPELIADGDGDLMLIRRELPVADSEVGTGRWSLDHLFVTRECVPVLVELKRASDSRLRREVVGQLLDYAANATAYWQAGRMADSFAATAAAAGRDPAEALSSFIGDRDPGSFWDQVDANFQAGRIKLVFVADEIPRELARVVEFLNDQMRAEVRAVELRWFAGEGGLVTLSPRIIGETERAAAVKAGVGAMAPMSAEAWLSRHLSGSDADAVMGARAFVALIERMGGKLVAPQSEGGSLAGSFMDDDGRPLTPLRLGIAGRVELGLASLKSRPGLAEDDARLQVLDDLARVVGGMSTRNLAGYPSFPVASLADDAIATGVEDWLREWLPRMRQRTGSA